MEAGIQLVLAMGYSITVSAAELLMTKLYQHLFAGEDLLACIRRARLELANDKVRRAYFGETDAGPCGALAGKSASSFSSAVQIWCRSW